jgi:hypothetical protein
LLLFFYFVVATNGQILFFSPYYWSDMFTVLVNMSTSMQICEDWNINDMTIQTMHHENVTSCPCSLDVALLDLTRFHIDPLCVETAVNVYDCYQQPFAKLCFKQNLPSWVFKSYTRKQIAHKIYTCSNKSYLHVRLTFYTHVENTACGCRTSAGLFKLWILKLPSIKPPV